VLLGCAPVAGDIVAGDTLRFASAKVSINKKHGKIVVQGQGLGISQQVQLGLTLRSSREDATTWEHQNEITYLDMDLVCPIMTAYSSGKLTGVTYLDACGLPTPFSQVDPVKPGPSGGTEGKTPVLNIEILDTVLIDVTNTAVFARAGIAR
jgi:hypothetical protein